MFNNSTPFNMPVVPAYTSNNGGMFGGDGSWWAILILFALFGGWGGNGFGGFGGGFGGGRGYVEPCATQADVRTAVDQQTLISKIDQQTYGLSSTFTALNDNLNSNFRGIDNAICTLGYQNQQGFSNIASQMASCCCETQRLVERGFADTNYNLATQACDTRNAIANSTRDIIDNANANNRALLDFLVNDKISSLQAENQSLKFKASQAEQNAFITANQQAQTAELIHRLSPTPTPAYVVPNPNCCYNAQVSFANGCGCGCGNF